jgi:hypothetical protein
MAARRGYNGQWKLRQGLLILQPLGGLLGPVGQDDVGAGAAEAGSYRRGSVQSTELTAMTQDAKVRNWFAQLREQMDPS